MNANYDLNKLINTESCFELVVVVAVIAVVVIVVAAMCLRNVCNCLSKWIASLITFVITGPVRHF